MAACGRADSSSNAGGDGGIPALFFQEALHGAEGDTIFPSPAALGSSWEPSLLEQVLTTVAASARALGSHAVLAPVLDLFVDPRFGRLQEGFGEDPMHVAAFARAAAIGLQGAPPADDAGGGGSSSNPKMASRSSSTRRHGEDQSAGDGGPTSRGHHGGNANGDGRRGSGGARRSVHRLRAGRVYAIAKHFLGYGAVAGGLNGGATTADERSLLEDHLRPWRAFAAAGGAGAMVGHQAALGVPLHAHHSLIRGVLRGKLGLLGPVFSDCNDVGGLVAFGVAANLTAAAVAAMNAGVDVDLQCGRRCPSAVGSPARSPHGGLPPSEDDGAARDCGAFFELPRAIRSGMLPASTLRAAATRMLSLKASAGLLRTPLEPEGSGEVGVLARLNSRGSRALATTAAERGAILLRNRHALLPLLPLPLPAAGRGAGGRRPFRIAVIGPAAGCGAGGEGGKPGALCAAQLMMLGSYASALSTRRVAVPTLVAEMRSQLAAGAREGGSAVVDFALGAHADDDGAWNGDGNGDGIGDGIGGRDEADARRAARQAALMREAAVALARRSDVVIVALGDTARTAGEWADRASLELPGHQPALLAALAATGTPLALVIVGGRPVTFGGARGDALLRSANVSSLLFTYPPGQEGGSALARLLLGAAAPGGRLAHAWPRRAGPSAWLQPVSGKWRTHAWVPSGNGGGGRDGGSEGEQPWRYGAYVDAPTSPLFPFGFGLSYRRCLLHALSTGRPIVASAASIEHLPTAIVSTLNIEIAVDGEADAPTGRSGKGCTEVVQCYVHDPPGRTVRRGQRLVGFARVELRGQEQRRWERIEITAEALSVLDDDGRWRLRPGKYDVQCGLNSADPRMLRTSITVN